MRIAIPVLLLAGCGAPARVPVDPPCREISREAIAPEDPAFGGVTAGALLDTFVGEHPAVLTWSAGGDSALTVELRDLGPVFRLELAGGAETCGEVLAIPATVLLRTEDGQLDEIVELDVHATEAGASFDATLDASRLTGTFEPRPEDVEGEHVELGVRGDFMPSGASSGDIGISSWSCEGDTCGGGGTRIATWRPAE